MAARNTKKPGTNGVNSYDAEMAKFADKYAKAESKGAGGNFLSTKGGTFQFNGAQLGNGREFDAIVIDYRLVNSLYEGAYDPSNPASPICYSIGDDEETLAPHDEAKDKQCENCADCDLNKFGSGGGRGKACKNTRRLAIITEDSLGGDDTPTIALLSVPPTSIKNWSGYVQQVAGTLRKPPFAVVTRIKNTPTATSSVSLTFEVVRQLDQSELEAVLARRGEAGVAAEVTFPDFSSDDAPKSKAVKQQAKRPIGKVAGKPGQKPKFAR